MYSYEVKSEKYVRYCTPTKMIDLETEIKFNLNKAAYQSMAKADQKIMSLDLDYWQSHYYCIKSDNVQDLSGSEIRTVLSLPYPVDSEAKATRL